MRYADLDTQRVTPEPKMQGATCPGCSSPVVAKCGTVNIWHWAHAAGSDCDSWYEPMTQWHLDWQFTVPPERREVVMGNHRADLITTRGLVVEIQHSHISTAEIAEREAHYGQMVWIFDARDAIENGPYGPRLDIRSPAESCSDTYVTFRWKHARVSLAACRQPIYLDLGSELLHVGRIYPDSPVGGFGWLWTRQEVIDCINADIEES